MPEKERIGFIGLGIMGLPMAGNLLEAGYAVTVQNRSPGKAEKLAGEYGGATAVKTPKEVAENSDIIVTMLPDSPDVMAVMSGEDGVLAGLSGGALVVDMSTISPGVTKGLAEEVGGKGAGYLDAPVSGGDVGAKGGTLSIMVGGERSDFARARSIFEVMGGTVTHVGPVGAGQVVKAANQVVVALTIQAVSEALVLAERGGVSREVVLDVLGGGLAGNKVMEVKREKFLSGEYEAGFRAELHHKDLGIALAAGREFGVALPATAVVDQMLLAIKQKGLGGEDHSALIRIVEGLSGA
ncbi:2-hydroxy-3-oxopropionate reductase [Rubrobacter indicoceani]|uniref:2-hydroxy-3-oxopropionate reductase n=1 Tax=Rubrobacter indicoceani TaxID=2051957 RepID=UPI000E5B8042|nr:2-hydroxy-3-oxopropionate reductase [Rubrobacter indicoceani]